MQIYVLLYPYLVTVTQGTWIQGKIILKPNLNWRHYNYTRLLNLSKFDNAETVQSFKSWSMHKHHYNFKLHFTCKKAHHDTDSKYFWLLRNHNKMPVHITIARMMNKYLIILPRTVIKRDKLPSLWEYCSTHFSFLPIIELAHIASFFNETNWM